MRRCAVLNCTNNSGKPSSVSDHLSFHHFPKDPETRKAWIYATGRLNWTPRQYSTICSEHFTEYDFTMRNGKRFLRSTTVPRFNLTEQNSRYSESQYHNETQAALKFLTGQLFAESQVEHEAEVVTMQVIGGNNPNVVVKKPQIESNTPEKKPRNFSTVKVFKSEAELKAEKDKIHELIRDNVDPSISKILLSFDETPVKKKKKKSVNLPKPKNRCVKLKKNISLQDTSATSEGHYTDTLSRAEIIHKLKQRDLKISQQQITIRELQKTHLRDKVLIESLEIKLKLKNDQTVEESTSERNQYTRSDFVFKKPAQQIITQKRQRIETTNLENHYQANRNFSDQNQVCFDTQNRQSDVEFKKSAHKTLKRKRVEPKNHQSNRNFSDQDEICFDTRNRHSVIELQKPARQQIQNLQRMETTNLENHYQSSWNYSDRDRVYFNKQKRHSEVGLKKPAQQTNVIIQKQEIIKGPDTEKCNQSNMIFSDQDKKHFWNF